MSKTNISVSLKLKQNGILFGDVFNHFGQGVSIKPDGTSHLLGGRLMDTPEQLKVLGRVVEVAACINDSHRALLQKMAHDKSAVTAIINSLPSIYSDGWDGGGWKAKVNIQYQQADFSYKEEMDENVSYHGR